MLSFYLSRSAPDRNLRNAVLGNKIKCLLVDRQERLVLAWMSAKWPCITHITSARREEHLLDSLSSVSLAVSAEEIAVSTYITRLTA